MSDYEILRGVLEAIVGSYPETTEPDELFGWIGMVRSIANNALGDTAEDSEMEQLRAWLLSQVAYAKKTGSISAGHWADYCNAVLVHIANKFCYK